MARTAGRLREELPAAAAAPFDTLLRQMLNAPTVEALARFLREQERSQPDQPGAGLAEHRTGSIASLVRFGERVGEPLRVMFHAGLGTMESFRPLAARLTAQDLGPVVGIAVADPQAYCALDPATAVDRLADDYTEQLLAEGHVRFQLIGYCVGGLCAVEVARRLLERGFDVDDVALVSSHPVLVDVEEDLMIEALFVPNLGLRLDQLGLGAVAALFRRLAEHSQEERLTLYANAASRISGQYRPPEMVSGLFRVLRQSFLSVRVQPAPYTGDIRFLLPQATSGFTPGMDEATLAFWDEVCLGELRVVSVDGDHFSCMNEPEVAGIAAHIAAGLPPARGARS